jgi:hypothetical protein
MRLLYYSDLDQRQEHRRLLRQLKQIYFDLSPQSSQRKVTFSFPLRRQKTKNFAQGQGFIFRTLHLGHFYLAFP